MNVRLLLPLALLALSGCSLKGAQVPSADIPFAEADYTLMGKTSAESCGTYILGIDWGHLFKNESASTTGGDALPIPLPIGGGTAEQKRALYDALEKMPDATHLLEPRVESSFSGVGTIGLPMFGKRCAMVHAHGVKISDKAFSRLND